VGAVTIEGTWRTTASPDEVWAVVVDLGTWPQWWPAIRSVEELSGDLGAPDAARFVFDTPAPLRPLDLELTVVERSAPVRLVVRADRGPLRGGGTLELAPFEGGCATSFDVELSVRSRLLRPVEMVLANATRGAGKTRLARAGDDLARLAGGAPLAHSL
jgi:uncharacterized protein YndB with AHSA1/START domain